MRGATRATPASSAGSDDTPEGQQAFTASEEAAAQAVFELAAGTMDEKTFYEFLRTNSKKSKQ